MKEHACHGQYQRDSDRCARCERRHARREPQQRSERQPGRVIEIDGNLEVHGYDGVEDGDERQRRDGLANVAAEQRNMMNPLAAASSGSTAQ